MSKPKSAKVHPQSIPAAEPSAAVWFKLYPAKWAGLAMRESDNAKLGDRVRRIILALCEQETGADAFSDEVMQTTADAMQRYSEAGRKAARARWADKTPCDRNAIGMRSDTKRQEGDKKETRKEGDKTRPKTKPRETGQSVSVRESVCMSLGIQDSPELRQETIENLAPDELPVWASNFCQESDPVQAAFAYRKQLHRIGAETFREELSAFVAELDGGGEEPDSRGAAFMSRLKDAADGGEQ